MGGLAARAFTAIGNALLDARDARSRDTGRRARNPVIDLKDCDDATRDAFVRLRKVAGDSNVYIHQSFADPRAEPENPRSPPGSVLRGLYHAFLRTGNLLNAMVTGERGVIRRDLTMGEVRRLREALGDLVVEIGEALD